MLRSPATIPARQPQRRPALLFRPDAQVHQPPEVGLCSRLLRLLGGYRAPEDWRGAQLRRLVGGSIASRVSILVVIVEEDRHPLLRLGDLYRRGGQLLASALLEP